MARVRLTTIALALCGALGMAVPSFAAAGSIGGHIEAEGSGDPIQGVYVCPRPEPYTFETNCTETNAEGNYRLDGLPAASYYLSFYTAVNDLNYVSESYDDVPLFSSSRKLIPLADGQELGDVDAELEEGGIIEGSAEDGSTSGPAVGVEVCAAGGEVYECAISGSDGSYAINALPTGEYIVSFEGGNAANYLKRWYDEAVFSSAATKVPVTAGGPPASGIDAVLQPGSQILGRVTEAGTGAALKGIQVCVLNMMQPPWAVYPGPCVVTDAAGNYAIRSLVPATYKVGFSEEPPAGNILDDTFFEQWWQGVPSIVEATQLNLSPAQTAAGIDAHLVNMIQKPKPDPIQVSIIPRQAPKPPPRKCRKGFHKKKVKGGKKKCVRKHKRHGKKGGKGSRNGGKRSVSR